MEKVLFQMSYIYDIVQALEQLNKSQWWIHESKLYDLLDLDQLKLVNDIDCMGKVSKILKALEVGYLKDGNQKYGLPYCIPHMSNWSIANDLNMWYTQYGTMKGLFPTSLHPHSKQRWIAKGCVDSFVDVAEQYKMVQYATGRCKSEKDVTRRKELYIGWFRNSGNDDEDYTTYQQYHLPDIYKRFKHLFSSPNLSVVGNELRECLVISNMIPEDSIDSSSTLQSSQHTSTFALTSCQDWSLRNASTTSQGSNLLLSPPTINRINDPIHSDISDGNHPTTLDKSYLVPIQDFMKRFDNSESSLVELSILEFTLAQYYHNHYLHDLAIEYSIPVKVSPNMAITTLESLSSSQLGYIGSIIKKKQEDYFNNFHVFFKIQENQLLVDWLEQGRRFNDGERLPPSNTEKNTSNGKLWFTDEAMSYVRHMICSYGLSCTRFPSLMNCFSVLLLRRPLKDEEFPLITMITSQMLRLDVFDSFAFSVIFQNKITVPSQYGFPMFSYVMTDDTKMDGVQLHAIIRSVIGKNDSKSFCLYSTSASSSKDSTGNAQKNFEVLVEKESNQVLVHTGGGNSDHENSATKEIDVTFFMIMNKLEREAFAHGPFSGNKIYGVLRRVIRNEDWFHSVNLAVMLASLGAFGPTIKDNTQNQHKQVHY